MALLQKAYLGATPLFRQQDWFEDGAATVVNVSAATTLTADSAAHTKGAWSQVIASTNADSSLLFIQASAVGVNGTNTATLLDIGTGASGSETAIISNIAIGGAASVTGTIGVICLVPFKIASGTRLSARIQSVVTGGKTAQVTLVSLDAGDYNTAPTSVDTIGADTATSQGLSMSGSSGTWVEAISSTTRAYRAVAMIASSHSNDTATINVTKNVGVGAASNEVAFGSLRTVYTNSELAGNIQPYISLFGRNIPAGSRLAVQHDIASNSTRYGVTLIGIP